MTGAEMLLDGIEVERTEQAPSKETPAGAPAKASGSEKALKLQLKNERQRASEAENNARYWHEQAQKSSRPAPVAAKKEEENPADFIEQLTEKGPAAIDELLAKRGYVRQDEVEARIAQARNQVTVESALARDYPDLQDSESDFFKETAAQYQQLVAETPELKGNPKTMRLAAKLAAAEFEAEAPAKKTPKGRAAPIEDDDDDDQDEEPLDTPEQRETSRVRRVQSQSVSGRHTRREATGDDDGLNSVQKGIVANLRAAGANITEESLIKRIQGGTKLSGRIGMAAAAMRRGRR